jgi:hypothetical protein
VGDSVLFDGALGFGAYLILCIMSIDQSINRDKSLDSSTHIICIRGDWCSVGLYDIMQV